MLGAVILADGRSSLKPEFQVKPIRVLVTGKEDTDGKMVIDAKHGMPVKILQSFDQMAYYDIFANRISDDNQSAVVGSFHEQRRV
ncbi:hypothetical protein RDABS01_000774 [Bienertia sinuspersici]